jgi:hypothetical protein
VNGFKKEILLRNSGGLSLVAAVGLFWWAGTGLVPVTGPDQSEVDASFAQARAKATRSSQAAVTLNREAGWPVELEGLAIVYPDEVNPLVRDDRSFRTDLTLAEMAKILNLPPESIAMRGEVTRVDPDAVLFRVALGRLSEDSKADCREVRAIAARERWEISPEVYEWVASEQNFTLRALMKPNPEQQTILDAIGRAARGETSPPGVKIRAVACWRAHQPGDFSFLFTGGCLPREQPPTGGLAATGAGMPVDGEQ